MNKKLIFVYFVAIALVLGACFSPWKDDEGIFSVSIGGQDRSAWNNTDILAELAHTITLSDGPGPEQTRENVKYGDTVYFSVTPGRWTITITASLYGEIYATGSQPVDIKSGRNGAIAIKMTPVTSGGSEEPGETDIITVTNGDDEGEGSLRWAMRNSPEVITIIIKNNVNIITLNDTLPALSFEIGTKSVTIKAEKEVTIQRGSDCLYQLFSVGGGGTLIMGGAGSAKIIIDGNNINAQTPLIDIAGPGAFIMNDGVMLQNNKNNGPNGGGGVAVSNGGTFTMKGGTISGNTAANGGGGVAVLVSGTFIMSGGEISNNITSGQGGGVYVGAGGEFFITNGIIWGKGASNANKTLTASGSLSDQHGHALYVETIAGTGGASGSARYGKNKPGTSLLPSSDSHRDSTIQVEDGELMVESTGESAIVIADTFTGIDALKTWLSGELVNGATYKIKLNIDDLGGAAITSGSLGSVFLSVSNIYIILDLSGSTIDTIPTDAFFHRNDGTFIRIPCDTLVGITLPDTVTTIKPSGFEGCPNLKSIIIPNGVETIDVGTFYQCTSLASVSIPDSVTGIEYEAFAYCSSLTSITIPKNVTQIGSGAFMSCTSLTSVTFNSVIEEADFYYSAFYDLGNLREKYLAADGGKGTYIRPSGDSEWTKKP